MLITYFLSINGEKNGFQKSRAEKEFSVGLDLVGLDSRQLNIL